MPDADTLRDNGTQKSIRPNAPTSPFLSKRSPRDACDKQGNRAARP